LVPASSSASSQARAAGVFVNEASSSRSLRPRAGHVAERQRRGEAGVAVALRQPALQHGIAVAAAQERNLVLVEVLARDIDQHAEQLALQAAQVLAERRDARSSPENFVSSSRPAPALR